MEGIVAEARAGYTRARALVRAASGVRVLLALLHARASMAAQACHALRALAVRCLLGLAHDPALRHILSKLQVGLRGSHGPGGPCIAGSSCSFNRMATQLMALTSPGLQLSRCCTGSLHPH